MNQKQSHSKSSNIHLSFYTQRIFILLLFINSFYSIAQNSFVSKNKEPYKVITYGEKTAFGKIDNNAKWKIRNYNENISIQLYGNQINDYVFEKPGTYEIDFSENNQNNEDECSHAKFDATMIVQVSSTKMIFDFSKIKFSDKIQVGQSCDDIDIVVPVNFTTYDGNPVKLIIPNVVVAGIGSQIIAKPINSEIIFKNGIQAVKYQLSGTATQQAYLMFDFVDANNQIQSYSYPEIIN